MRMLRMLLSGRSLGAVSGLPADVQVERDLAYGPDPAHRLDVYRPAGRAAGPLLVLVHGGAWAIGDKAGPALLGHKLAHWLPKGYVVVSVNYRLLPLAQPLEQARDLARALGFVQARAASWGAEAERLALLGHSSGAHLVALVAADADLAEAAGLKRWSASVLIDSAALDVVQTMSGAHRPLHDRAFGSDPAYWSLVSPMQRLRGRPPQAPMLLVHDAGRPASGEQSRRFAATVTALGGRAEVCPMAMSHVELNAELGRDAGYTERVDAFLRTAGLT
ncbi:alpha/beta hydrolase [Aquabacterium sp.]|uniref:alpha/beta hydrolase n=1 Tax=Aquabacterium sp. TaxID=1872578 RepID=UPI002C749A21|nr:alpha/beta hydrolase [Aquabacterium sp.]HSW05266.1 alpha/beta hydrolase [Aquabacterium sp.]